MSGHNLATAIKMFLVLAVLLVWTGNASAYVGPGAGLELVGYGIGLLAWMLTAFSAVCLWPIYALIRRIRGGKDEPASENPLPESIHDEAHP